MKRNLALCVLTFGLIFGAAGAARGDVPPPNSTECNKREPGDACKTDDSKPGVCTASTCTKLDYSDGSPPGTVQYACDLCVATDGGTDTPTGTTGGGSSGGGGCAVTGTPSDGAWWLGAALALGRLRRRRVR